MKKLFALAFLALTSVSAFASYDNEYTDLDAYSSYSGTSTSLGECAGTITVRKLSDTRAKVYFTADQCSRVEWKNIDGYQLETDGKLNTEEKPYTGAWYISGSFYRSNNKARVTLRSKSGKHGVNVYIHF